MTQEAAILAYLARQTEPRGTLHIAAAVLGAGGTTRDADPRRVRERLSRMEAAGQVQRSGAAGAHYFWTLTDSNESPPRL